MPRDFLKFAHLYMNNGKLNGRQIIDEYFVSESIKPISEGIGEWFGLDWSVRKFNDEKTLIGLEVTDGQFMFFIPDEKIAALRFTKYFHNYNKGHQIEFGFLRYLLWYLQLLHLWLLPLVLSPTYH